MLFFKKDISKFFSLATMDEAFYIIDNKKENSFRFSMKDLYQKTNIDIDIRMLFSFFKDYFSNDYKNSNVNYENYIDYYEPFLNHIKNNSIELNFIDWINYVEENIFSLDKHHGFMFKRSGGVGKIDFSNDISTETDFIGCVRYLEKGYIYSYQDINKRATEIKNHLQYILEKNPEFLKNGFYNKDSVFSGFYKILEHGNFEIVSMLYNNFYEHIKDIENAIFISLNNMTEDFNTIVEFVVSKHKHDLNTKIKYHFYDYKEATNYFSLLYNYHQFFDNKLFENLLKEEYLISNQDEEFHIFLNKKMYSLIENTRKKDEDFYKKIKIFYKLGVNVNNFNKNPLNIAIKNRDNKLLDTLLELGFKFDKKGNNDNYTPKEQLEKIIKENIDFIFMSKKAGIDLDSFFPMNFSIETS